MKCIRDSSGGVQRDTGDHQKTIMGGDHLSSIRGDNAGHQKFRTPSGVEAGPGIRSPAWVEAEPDIR
jgi:hypothetical protein